MSVQLAAGNLEARAAPPSVSELDTLTRSLNTMADQLDELIENRIADQRSLRKAEMRTLQAQITPHFIYNTLDTICLLYTSAATLCQSGSDGFQLVQLGGTVASSAAHDISDAR